MNKKYRFPSNIKHLSVAGYASQLEMLPTFTSFSMVHSFYASIHYEFCQRTGSPTVDIEKVA
jgi:hypothetical protein